MGVILRSQAKQAATRNIRHRFGEMVFVEDDETSDDGFWVGPGNVKYTSEEAASEAAKKLDRAIAFNLEKSGKGLIN